MHQVNLQEAEIQLATLIEEAARGEEVVITRSDGTSFKIVPISVVKPRPKFGSAKGLVRMSDDFDAPLEDFESYCSYKTIVSALMEYMGSTQEKKQ